MNHHRQLFTFGADIHVISVVLHNKALRLATFLLPGLLKSYNMDYFFPTCSINVLKLKLPA